MYNIIIGIPLYLSSWAYEVLVSKILADSTYYVADAKEDVLISSSPQEVYNLKL